MTRKNRLASGKLLSNDRRVVGFSSTQLGLRGTSIEGGGGQLIEGVGLGGLVDENRVQTARWKKVPRGEWRVVIESMVEGGCSNCSDYEQPFTA